MINWRADIYYFSLFSKVKEKEVEEKEGEESEGNDEVVKTGSNRRGAKLV